MPNLAACPDDQTLAELLLGQLPPADLDSWSEHVAVCAQCAERAAVLKPGDTLSEALTATKKQTLSNSDPLASELVKKLRDVWSVRSQPALEPTSAPDDASLIASSIPTIPSDVAAVCSLLRPPQQPDELGRLGGYRVLKVLGHGGMGMVFQAEDPQLGRKVALKVMKPSASAHSATAQRFLLEARAAATLKNDHIVTIYQVGDDHGVPFLAMEFLEGCSLGERLRAESKLSIQESLRLGIDVATGLAAAQQRNLIHRDIKPDNIWLESKTVARDAERSGVSFRAKILDFGLARAAAAGDQQLTREGAIVGTPAFMAPEQARAGADHRSDLFSLGVVLYHVLTGVQPFQGDDTWGTLMAVVTHDPRPPHELNCNVPMRLSRLVMELLRKDPNQRLQPAAAVVGTLESIEQELRATPAAQSRPPLRRGWMAAAVALAALVPLTLLLGGTVYRFVTDQGLLVVDVQDPQTEVLIRSDGLVIRDHGDRHTFTVKAGQGELEVLEKGSTKLLTRQFTLSRGGKAKVTVSLQELAAARQALLPPQVRPMPEKTPTPVAAPSVAQASPYDALRREDISPYELRVAGSGDAAKAAPELVAIRGDSHLQAADTDVHGLRAVTYFPDGKQLATSCADHYLRIWDSTTGEQIRAVLTSWNDSKATMALQPDGKLLHVVNFGAFSCWDPHTGEQQTSPFRHDGASAVEFNRDGRRAITMRADGEVKLWDLPEGKVRATFSTDAGTGRVFTGDAERLYFVKDKQLRLWSVAESKELEALPKIENPGRLALTPDDQLLVVLRTDDNRTLHVWDLQSKERKYALSRGTDIRGMRMSADGRYVGAFGNPIQIWKLDSGEFQGAAAGNTRDAGSFAFSPDGQQLASVGGVLSDGRVRLWDANGRELLPPKAFPAAIHCMRLDGNRAYCSGEGYTRLPDIVTGAVSTPLVQPGDYDFRIAADGTRMAVGQPSFVKVFDTETGTVLGGFKASGGNYKQHHLAVSPDGKYVAIGGEQVRIGNIETGDEQTLDTPGNQFAFLPDGKLLVGAPDQKLAIWNLTQAKREREFEFPANPNWREIPAEGFKVSPDGAWLAVVETQGHEVHLINMQSGKVAKQFPVRSAGRTAFFTFSHDSQSLAVANVNKVAIWNVRTGQNEHSLDTGVGQAASGIDYAPDGRHLVVANSNGTVFVFRLARQDQASKP